MALSATKAQQLPAVVDQFIYQDSFVQLDIEVDSVPDGDFGDLFRVWKSDRLLGTFYESYSGNGWIAQYIDSVDIVPCVSPVEAQMKIVEIYRNNQLV